MGVYGGGVCENIELRPALAQPILSRVRRNLRGCQSVSRVGFSQPFRTKLARRPTTDLCGSSPHSTWMTGVRPAARTLPMTATPR